MRNKHITMVCIPKHVTVSLTMSTGRARDVTSVSSNQGGHTKIRILSSVKMIESKETLVSHFGKCTYNELAVMCRVSISMVTQLQ